MELASGAPNKVIASNLQMTENTMTFHLKRVFQKLCVRHRPEALQAARARGLLPQPRRNCPYLPFWVGSQPLHLLAASFDRRGPAADAPFA